eukprot:TRINITY_DN37035_c0_g1_i2.p1 TRINITY_DN37035_c0_g1~~TRINITY_DN37035_c0_g1_i2.p1  ORF type:complete len:446 (+),score=101.64 TRINITY_DN37035_c0_g1_i2:68-1405(+)
MTSALAASLSTGPRSLAPREASDSHELKAVLAAQSAEIHSLKARLADAQRDCTRLRHKLQDAEGELHTTTEATLSASDRLSAHAVRQGLVLTAGVEKSGAERAKLEDELQHMERLLYERDQEIASLRQTAGTLESSQLQLELEMRGLNAARETATHEVRELSQNVADLLHGKLKKVEKSIEANGRSPDPFGVGAVDSLAYGSTSSIGSAARASQQEEKRLRESAQLLETKRQEHAHLKRNADQAAAEARHLEAEDAAISHRVTLFEKELRSKQAEMEAHDKHFVREGDLLREHVQELRQALEHEQKGLLGADQLIALQPQTADEVQGAKREILSIMSIMPDLENALRSRHQHVHSAEVPSDPIDVALHSLIRAGAEPVPAIVCRLGHADYVIGPEHVALLAGPGGSLLFRPAGRREESFKAEPLTELLRHQAKQHLASVHPHHHF